jgi:hypothetical protein
MSDGVVTALADPAQVLSAKVIEQVAYYLSPANLQRDTFLAAKLREGGGFVHATLLASFPRVKSIVEDTDVICGILWNSSEFNCKGFCKVARHPFIFYVLFGF